MHKPQILIVEDEAGIADTLQYALRTEGFDPVGVGTGAEAIGHLAQARPALVILDVGLPDTSGFEVFKRLRALAEDLPVIFLTARSDEIDRVVGLELGADDYVPKPFSPRELVARVRSILRRTRPNTAAAPPPVTTAAAIASETLAATGPLQVDLGKRQIRYYGQLLELSRYEFGLLHTLAARPGHVFTRDTLLRLVWDEDTDSIDRTVDAHVKTLRAKLRHIAPELDPIRTHRGSGYALAEDLPATAAPLGPGDTP